MNQAEGYLLRYGEKWRAGNHDLAKHVLTQYNHINKGTFAEYMDSMALTEKQMNKHAKEGTLYQITEVAEVLDQLKQ